MTQWEVLLVGIVILELVALIINTFINPSKKRDQDIAIIIQQNTDAIKGLTTELKDLTTTNTKDHDHFHKSINGLNQDVALLKQKHNSDIKLLEEHIRKD